MSTTERHWGYMQRLPPPPQLITIEKQIEYLIGQGHKIDYEIDEGELYIDSKKSDCVYVGGEWYKLVSECRRDDDQYFNHSVETKDGKIFYVSVFHNGGTCFEEELDDIIKNKVMEEVIR